MLATTSITSCVASFWMGVVSTRLGHSLAARCKATTSTASASVMVCCTCSLVFFFNLKSPRVAHHNRCACTHPGCRKNLILSMPPFSAIVQRALLSLICGAIAFCFGEDSVLSLLAFFFFTSHFLTDRYHDGGSGWWHTFDNVVADSPNAVWLLINAYNPPTYVFLMRALDLAI